MGEESIKKEIKTNSVNNYINRVFYFFWRNTILAQTSIHTIFYDARNTIYRRQYTLARLEGTYSYATRDVYW
ncbi:hypothetical protein KUL118_58450 [Tenacibaculum sp. KUL118]|nr:hypothetical protein KUL118_58450 [Tenacibaculum sp. KUL118]